MLEHLKAAVKYKASSKWLRFVRHPLRMVTPGVMRRVAAGTSARATTFFGRQMEIYLPEPVSISIWQYGFFEADVATFLIATLEPGGAFIDVGGHFGFFSMLGRELVGPEGVVATFEPMPATREILGRNMREHAAKSRHHLVPAAAGSRPGKLVFKDFGLCGSAFATSESQRCGDLKLLHEVEVAVRTVDDVVDELGFDRLSLIKIDAENAEAEVLAGAETTIERLKPALIIETGDMGGSTARPILDSLVRRGYIIFDFDAFSLVRHEPVERYGYDNFLLVHRDRLGDSGRLGPVLENRFFG
jgi:FkbM family methyltransferase